MIRDATNRNIIVIIVVVIFLHAFVSCDRWCYMDAGCTVLLRESNCKLGISYGEGAASLTRGLLIGQWVAFGAHILCAGFTCCKVCALRGIMWFSLLMRFGMMMLWWLWARKPIGIAASGGIWEPYERNFLLTFYVFTIWTLLVYTREKKFMYLLHCYGLF